MAVTSAGPYASQHLAPDRQPPQNQTTQFFTGRMPFICDKIIICIAKQRNHLVCGRRIRSLYDGLGPPQDAGYFRHGVVVVIDKCRLAAAGYEAGLFGQLRRRATTAARAVRRRASGGGRIHDPRVADAAALGKACRHLHAEKLKVAHTRLPSVGYSGADPGSWQSACRSRES